MFADSHNHLHLFRDPGAAVRAMRQAGIAECVVNATSEADWHEVAQLAGDFPGFVRPAFGVHPWLAHHVRPGWRERLQELLENHPAAALGECGLDRTRRAPPLAMQAPVFQAQLALARQLGRPATIHCVQAWGALFDFLDRTPPPRCFLLHSFQGSRESATRLTSLGAFFSVPARGLARSADLPPATAAAPADAAASAQRLRWLPPDRILLETDAPGVLPPADPGERPERDAANDPARLPEIAATLAATLGWAAGEFASLAFANHRRCFGVP